MRLETTIAPVIEELLTVLGCKELHSFYIDFNLPSAIIDVPALLSERTTQTLQVITSLTGNCFEVFDQTEKFFFDFLSRFGESYPSETVQQFIDWTNRHGIDNDYYACLTLWGWTLSSFDGWSQYRLLDNSQEELQKKAFSIYQRLLDGNRILTPSWKESRLKCIEDKLGSLRSGGYRDGFFERYSLTQQINIVEAIMDTERSYRFLTDLKRKGSGEDMNQIVNCGKMLGANSGWPATSLKKLVFFQDEHRKWLLSET